MLHAGESAQILGASTGTGTYASYFGPGVTCIWGTGSAGTELYVGVSTIIDWKGAQAIDRLTKTTSALTIAGHPAESGGPHGSIGYALVHVAVGGDHDPVLEFRAPTEAIALRLAQTVTPRLQAITSAG